MASPMDAVFRQQIEQRHQRLQAAIAQGVDEPQVRRLLDEVDAALARLELGTFGICETCHDPIEEDRLRVDPLLRNCLDHLSSAEQRALERDLDLAGQIQGALLPKGELSLGSWEAVCRYLPAGPVSGDCCDLLPSADRSTMVFLVGDVAGKGVAASLLMAHLNATFRNLVASALPLAEMMEKANTVFCNSVLSEHYATLACGEARPGGRIDLCNGGHPPAIVLRRSGIEPLRATGLPLGMFCASTYRVERLTLDPGDGIFLYTDGLSEATDASGTEYGAARLGSFLEAHRRAAPGELIAACLDDLKDFLGGRSRADDLTVMALRYGGSGAA